ncbi:hypothetical protein U9M48_030068 [Paspalum notatum var. saurae]|uniref:ATP-dependent DNA helicase n=1 Tax=Paspalum notatum var. saurae TaxID=547442 RepID=A0AAQ3X2X4_PASNO
MKDIDTYPLPKIIEIYDDARGTVREEYEERIIEPTTQDMALKDSLNEEQKAAYDKILSTVDTDNGGVFFVDGPGGTGKTYLYKALLATLRSQDKIAVATATSGVAASIMPGERTAHSRFKIPLNIDDGVVCSFTKQGGTAKLLHKASLIIWDEASMTKRQAVEALDNSLRDIMDCPRLPFGGKTVVFGDFRKSDPWFAEYLLRIRGGTEESKSESEIRLPDDVCVPYTGSDCDLDGLIDHIFPMLDENMSNPSYITSRAILSTRNDWFKRKQFPVRLSFAMTVNKAQSQTIPNVGVYLPELVFSHGQLYVALSRATSRSNIKILVIPATDNNKKKTKKKRKSATSIFAALDALCEEGTATPVPNLFQGESKLQ